MTMLFEGDIVTNVRLDEVRNALGAQASLPAATWSLTLRQTA